MEDKEKSEKKHSLEEDGKASVYKTVSSTLSWSNSVHVSETEELSTNLFLDEGADSTHIELQASESHLSIPVQETESLNLLRSTEEPASSDGETSESEYLSMPVQESGGSHLHSSTDEPTSPFMEDKLYKYSPIPVSLPPTGECQLCSTKFGGNFHQYNITFCGDCIRFRDFESCDTKDYKRPSGPPMTIF
ncbi:hypothetical protein HOLleu_34057 [Holothuria leucospilota]|uniref:Uncharacterized protein n=1 Tax=Holothuria leucospilota TaxID=206669 RepID=A0A9Q0YPQ7_HOLLE|nr:hypothetical protein HOLleu_34057 [Holothuria leucospilota]